jgi:hypothetical protein
VTAVRTLGLGRCPTKRSGRCAGRTGEVLSAVEKDHFEELLGAVLAIRLLLLTGARRDEILGLRWQGRRSRNRHFEPAGQ